MKKKGNISLLILFVLVACSLLGIIAVQYTKHIAIQTNQVYNYYKTYYLAKWWSEIWLSLMQLRWAWYALDIEENSNFVKQNINTGNAFSLKIQWRWNLLSSWHPSDNECTNPITIASWQNYILPLFLDNPDDFLQNHFSNQKYYTNKSDILKSITIENNDQSRINIWIIISSWWELNEYWIFFTSWIFQWDDFFEKFSETIQTTFETTNDQTVINRQNWDLQNYVIIANKSQKELTFCLKLPEWEELSLSKTYISSFWYAGNKKLWLETIYQQPIPSYLIDSTIVQ